MKNILKVFIESMQPGKKVWWFVSIGWIIFCMVMYYDTYILDKEKIPYLIFGGILGSGLYAILYDFDTLRMKRKKKSGV